MRYESCVKHAKAKLDEAVKSLDVEISNYPTPIAGCDQQFNHLLEERRRVNNALDALSEVLSTPTPRQLEAVN